MNEQTFSEELKIILIDMAARLIGKLSSEERVVIIRDKHQTILKLIKESLPEETDERQYLYKEKLLTKLGIGE